MINKNKLKILVILVLFLSAGYFAYSAISSTLWKQDPYVINCGGGNLESGNFKLLANADESAVGVSESPNYKIEAGFLYMLPGPDDLWLRITQLPAPAFIGYDGNSSFTWISDKNGSYDIIVNGNVMDSGVCSAGVPKSQPILETDLVDNSQNGVMVVVTAVSEQNNAVVGIYDDQIPPDFSVAKITVTGTVDDDTVTQVVVNGVNVPVLSNSYTAEVSSGIDEITVEATNAAGKIVTRIIAKQQ